LISKRCTELERGARMVDALITNTLLPEIGREFLNRLVGGGMIKRVHVGATDKDFTFAFD
jgi:type VI secretion system protein VasG